MAFRVESAEAVPLGAGWRGFRKHASRTKNLVPETALATLVTLFETEHLLATHSLTHYERTPLGESPHRRLAFPCPWGVG